MEISIRHENRLSEPYSATLCEEFVKVNDVLPINPNRYLHKVFDELFEELFDVESSIDSKTDCLIVLNNNVQSSPKLLKPYLSDEIICSIFELTSIQPHICCLVYKLFAYLMKNYPSILYSIFLNEEIFKRTIDNIIPSLDHFTYYYILVFLCETIQQIPDSISHFIECGIVQQLNEMDQNDNVDQILIIYSNIVLESEDNDYSALSNVFDFLCKGNMSTISHALYYIQKCLQKQDSDYVWRYAIFDKRLYFLLEVQNAHIISNTILCYILICCHGDEAISMIIEENEILQKIWQFIFDVIEQILSNMHSLQNLGDNYIVASASLDLLLSMISNSDNTDNINAIYTEFIEFDFPNTIQLLNFQCKEKISHIALNLLCKIGPEQAENLFNEDFLDSIAQVMISDEEKLEIFDLALKTAKEKFVLNEDFISLIDGIQNKYCFD